MQSTTQKTKDWTTQPYKHGGELRSSQRISSSCSTNNNIKDSTTAVFVVFEWKYLSAFNTIVSLGRMSEWLMCCLTPIEQYSNYSMASLGVSFHDNKTDHCIICEGCILRASGKHLHDFVILLRTSFGPRKVRCHVYVFVSRYDLSITIWNSRDSVVVFNIIITVGKYY
jgi:hypothetical protein